MVDIGIFRRMTGMKSGFEFDAVKGFEQFKGAIAENYVLNELVSAGKEVPFYWRSNGIAEVDFLVQCDKEVLPLLCSIGSIALLMYSKLNASCLLRLI